MFTAPVLGGWGVGSQPGMLGRPRLGIPRGQGLLVCFSGASFLPSGFCPSSPSLPANPTFPASQGAASGFRQSLFVRAAPGAFPESRVPQTRGLSWCTSTRPAGDAGALGAGSGAPGPVCRGCEAAESPWAPVGPSASAQCCPPLSLTLSAAGGGSLAQARRRNAGGPERGCPAAGRCVRDAQPCLLWDSPGRTGHN